MGRATGAEERHVEEEEAVVSCYGQHVTPYSPFPVPLETGEQQSQAWEVRGKVF